MNTINPKNTVFDEECNWPANSVKRDPDGNAMFTVYPIGLFRGMGLQLGEKMMLVDILNLYKGERGQPFGISLENISVEHSLSAKYKILARLEKKLGLWIGKGHKTCILPSSLEDMAESFLAERKRLLQPTE